MFIIFRLFLILIFLLPFKAQSSDELWIEEDYSHLNLQKMEENFVEREKQAKKNQTLVKQLRDWTKGPFTRPRLSTKIATIENLVIQKLDIPPEALEGISDYLAQFPKVVEYYYPEAQKTLDGASDGIWDIFLFHLLEQWQRQQSNQRWAIFEWAYHNKVTSSAFVGEAGLYLNARAENIALVKDARDGEKSSQYVIRWIQLLLNRKSFEFSDLYWIAELPYYLFNLDVKTETVAEMEQRFGTFQIGEDRLKIWKKYYKSHTFLIDRAVYDLGTWDYNNYDSIVEFIKSNYDLVTPEARQWLLEVLRPNLGPDSMVELGRSLTKIWPELIGSIIYENKVYTPSPENRSTPLTETPTSVIAIDFQAKKAAPFCRDLF